MEAQDHGIDFGAVAPGTFSVVTFGEPEDVLLEKGSLDWATQKVFLTRGRSSYQDHFEASLRHLLL